MEDTIVYVVEAKVNDEDNQDNQATFLFKEKEEAREFFKKAEGTLNMHVLHVWQKHENALEELEQYREWVAENDRW